MYVRVYVRMYVCIGRCMYVFRKLGEEPWAKSISYRMTKIYPAQKAIDGYLESIDNIGNYFISFLVTINITL